MRKARDFWVGFDPRTLEEFSAAIMGPNGGYVRMVVGYWEMAASLVENGAIDRRMFQDATSEYLVVFGKLEPLLPQLREQFGNPGFAANLEKLALSLPDARRQIDGTMKRIRMVAAARAAAV